MTQTGKTINEEETLEKKFEAVMAELSSVEEEVRRYEERQEKQEKVSGCASLDPMKFFLLHPDTERFNLWVLCAPACGKKT